MNYYNAVGLDYNDHGYNEVTHITFKILLYFWSQMNLCSINLLFMVITIITWTIFAGPIAFVVTEFDCILKFNDRKFFFQDLRNIHTRKRRGPRLQRDVLQPAGHPLRALQRSLRRLAHRRAVPVCQFRQQFQKSLAISIQIWSLVCKCEMT